MYRYSLPKSRTWGHSLKKLKPTRQKELFEEFLKLAVAEHEMIGGILTLVTVPAAPFVLPANAQDIWGHVTHADVEHFERVLGAASEKGAFYSLTAEQCERVVEELGRNRALRPGAAFVQGYQVSKWLIDGQPAQTESMINLSYGMTPWITTLLQFETIDQFNFVQTVFSNLGLCTLSEKHLKPIKHKGRMPSRGEQGS